MNSGLNLVNKHAVVVGGTAGIGRGIATRLVRASCSVTIVGRESSRSKALMKELEQIASEKVLKSHVLILCPAIVSC